MSWLAGTLVEKVGRLQRKGGPIDELHPFTMSTEIGLGLTNDATVLLNGPRQNSKFRASTRTPDSPKYCIMHALLYQPTHQVKPASYPFSQPLLRAPKLNFHVNFFLENADL